MQGFFFSDMFAWFWLTALTREICEAALNWTPSLKQNHHNGSEHLQVGYTCVILTLRTTEFWCVFVHRFILGEQFQRPPWTHLRVYHDAPLSFRQSLLTRRALWLLLQRYTPACCDCLHPPCHSSLISAVGGKVLLPAAASQHLWPSKHCETANWNLSVVT